ncbi:MAG: aminodeoxychorismate/anthranilate synthase component II [Phycisphaeraceae bacterium]|nr:aminodeoxychorismate/anthranilate synthase component II [Phycisphaeraceae bacterium]
MILLIDNYDSFTYNLVQRIGEIDPGIDLRVVRNDKISVDQARDLNPQRIIISPGPCTPVEGGVSNAIIQHFAGKLPILGVCLGHQCIGHTHGMTIERHDRLMHGKTSPIHHDGRGVFRGLSNPFTATRYHSLVIRRDTIDESAWDISAWTAEGEVMGVRKKNSPQPLEGVQFHPESFLTTEGPRLLANFLEVDLPAAKTA